MQSFEFPIDPILQVLRSMFGRCFLVLLIVAVGYGTGTAIAEESVTALFAGTVLFHGTAFTSLLVSYGALAFVFIFVFAILYVVFEWSEWSLILPFLICVWVGWDTTDYILNRSPMARIERQINEGIRKSLEEKRDSDSKPEESGD